MTGYDPRGEVLEWGPGDIGGDLPTRDAHRHVVRTSSRNSLAHAKQHCAKHICRLRLKIRNKIDDCHKKLAKYLCENYRVVLLPRFNASQMVVKIGRGRKRRVINTKTVRQMMCWSHYRFRQRLQHKKREYPWCNVVECAEPYTSKTCTNCGWINHNLGAAKVFNCKQCGLEIDRDVGGARNILLRFLTPIPHNSREASTGGDSLCSMKPSRRGSALSSSSGIDNETWVGVIHYLFVCVTVYIHVTKC